MLNRLLFSGASVCFFALALGAAPIAPLIDDLDAADYATRQTARLALRQALVDAPASDRPRHEQELLNHIGPDHDWATRDWCFRMLELVGTENAVPALVSHLDDPDARIRDLARRTLAAIPSRRAIDALGDAAKQASDAERGAYADALAYRSDTRAVKPLTAMLRAGSADAALALGKIGNRSARSALRKAHASADSELKTAIELALLDAGLQDRRLATRLAQSGQTVAIQTSAFAQLTEIDVRSVRRLLDSVLAEPDDERRGLFLRHAMTAPAVRDNVVGRLPDLPEPDRIVVLEAIADLSLSKYEKAVLNLFADASETLLPVVARVLGHIGSDASFQPLLDRYLADPRDRAVTAALARLQAPSADRRLLATARDDGPVSDRVSSVRLLVLRNTEGVVELLNGFTGGGHPEELREAAFRGLEVVGDLESVRQILRVVLRNDPLKRAAQGSLKRLSANLGVPDALWHECYAPALMPATDDQKRDVLVIIDGISGPAAAAWLQQVVLENQPLHAEAFEALRRWTDVSGIDALVAIALADGATDEVVASAKQSILRITGSTRTSGLNTEKVARAAKAMHAFPEDEEFRRNMIATYRGDMHWQTRMEINRLFPEFLSDPAIAADVKELLERTRFN